MSMTKKDYELVAKALNTAKPLPYSEQTNQYITPKQVTLITDSWFTTCQTVANTLQDANVKFDRIKFIKACIYGLTSN